MKPTTGLVVTLLLLVGCHANPRYRSNGGVAEEQQTTEPNRIQATDRTSKFAATDSRQLIELGRILQSYLGTPYAGQSSFESGLDCSQFTQDVYRRFNKTQLPRTAAKQYSSGRKIDKGHLRYGDLVFFRTDGSGVAHVGIYVGHNEFIHSSSSLGVIITDLDDEYWKKRYAGARRILP
ncbi:MAG: C40 family peptidase [candidate division Zixibacteria bacterium]|nr:C40 family peptidase [candidate division Zixibacteria bacterium]